MPTSKPADIGANRLAAWLEIFHPAYRGYLAAMLAISIIGGIITFLNLEFLQGLVKTYGVMTRLGSMSCAEASDVHYLTGFFVCNGLASGWGVVLWVLAAYICLELAQAANHILRLLVQGFLEIRSRNDIEREILVNLLRKDDPFFQRNSATQIANRLNEDTERIFHRREDAAALWGVTTEAAGALFFLYTQHWSYAAAVLAFTLAGVLIIHRMLASVRALDAAQLKGDDLVKAAFEDYLYTAPETQMGNLTPKVAARLGAVQAHRQQAYVGLLRLNSRLTATYDLTELVAFSAIMAAIVYVVAAHGLTLEDGLVAAVVRAVPQTYGNITQIAKLVVKFQLAGVSAGRILEFATEAEPKAAPAPEVTAALASPAPLELKELRYAFTPGGAVQGGDDGISAAIPRRALTVLVGPSGSGKSMVSQLLMGRMQPLAGKVAIADVTVTGLPQSERARLFGYMPQSLAMIAGSIGDNIAFGLPETSLAGQSACLSDNQLQWVEATGVGQIAREKALDVAPAQDALQTLRDVDLPALRDRLRDAVHSAIAEPLQPLSGNAPVPHLTVLENLTHSSLDIIALPKLAMSRTGYAHAEAMALLPSSDRIITLASHVIERTRHLLQGLPSLEAYNEVAPQALIEPVWQLRSNLELAGPEAVRDPALRADFLLVGLTARPRELDPDATGALHRWLADRTTTQELADACRSTFAAALAPLHADQLNPWLCWRDNLLFASLPSPNASVQKAIDDCLLKAIAATPADRAVLETGLAYDVGRQGKRLSGGQRQMVALARTLVQSSPVLVLDEPTAALDPRRRGDINRLLKSVCDHHTVVAITHDMELARLADQVLMMTDGSLVASGTFDQLMNSNPAFRALVDHQGADRT